MTLQECVDRISEELRKLIEPFEKLAKEIRKIFEKIEEHKRLLRRPPKWYAKANNPAMIVSRDRVYRCRNNC